MPRSARAPLGGAGSSAALYSHQPPAQRATAKQSRSRSALALELATARGCAGSVVSACSDRTSSSKATTRSGSSSAPSPGSGAAVTPRTGQSASLPTTEIQTGPVSVCANGSRAAAPSSSTVAW
ncbi:MAG TPA: hypothetical protein VOA80_14450 [Thermoanaerobaculia bacterium]|nr:hypothetical protein [Thermoanaerobaculia bacterium]